MKNLRLVLLLTFTSICALKIYATVRLPAIIGDHMVLQQNAEVALWGWSDPTENIKINLSWDTTTYSTKGGPDAKWITKIKTPGAGGPYTITISGSNKIMVDDVLIGEVWDCSGQSNMEMSYSWGIKRYTNEIENASNQKIRFFHIPRLTAAYPQDDLKGHWVVCNPDDLKTFSLAGYFFGQKLEQVLNLPVGLIEASWGGTPAEVWTPKDSIESNTVLKSAADSLKVSDYWPVNTAATFNAMINPFTNFTIAGVIWYQGEANVGTASTYNELFATMINSWRQAWQINLPFYFVQIAPFKGYGGISGSLLQEAQTKTLAVPKTGMVVVHDLVDDVTDIHPKDKKDVGIRLANYALADVYGKKDIAYKSPMYSSMKIEKDKIRINFDNADNGLITKNGSPSDFYIAGEDKIFKPASAKIDHNSVVVWNKEIKNPVAVRFGFTNVAMPNLFNKEGLPANTFRTDDWNDVNTIIQN